MKLAQWQWVLDSFAGLVHGHRHAAGGPDPITPASIGAATEGQVSGSYFNLSGMSTFFGPDKAVSIGEAVKNVSASLGSLNLQLSAKAPMSHASAHATGGLDPITPASIGALIKPNDTLTSIAAGLPMGQGNYQGHADDAPLGSYYVSGATPDLGWPTSSPEHAMVICMGHNTTYAQKQQIFVTMYRRVMWIRNQHPTSGVWHSWRVVGSIEDTGSPEGRIVAPPGTEYTDTAGTNGAWKWMKKSGTGSTGWAVTEGDTGTRSVGSLILTENGYTGGGLYLYRTNNVCVLTASNLSRETAGVGYQRILVTPAGFKPFAPIYFAPFVGSAYGYLTPAELTLSGATTSNNFSISWITKDPWPTTLPGTPY